MYYAWVVSGDDTVPPVIRLMADPVRWRLMRELARGDQRVRELVVALGLPQNLVSYHLRQLRTGGLVTARRSSFDGRDTYYSLDLASCARTLADTGLALHPGLALHAEVAPHPGPALHAGAAPAPAGPGRRILFVCTSNSGRSPMAAALLRHRAGPWVSAASAGIRPKPLHPAAAAVLRDRYRLDISGHRPTRVDAVANERFDYVISLCDRAREECPEFAGSPGRVHWSIPEPGVGAPTVQAAYPAFERAAAELDTRIRFLLPALESIKTA